MSEKTKIEWCDHTFNPWRGCTKKPGRKGCAHCYAEISTPSRTARAAGIETWGDSARRIQASSAMLREPFKWNERPWVCGACGAMSATPALGHHMSGRAANGLRCCGEFHRAKVFSLSLGDWLDPMPAGMRTLGGALVDPVQALAGLLDTVRRCDNMDWLLCSKRWENFKDQIMLVMKWVENTGQLPDLHPWLLDWFCGEPPKHVWGLCSVEDQKSADDVVSGFFDVPLAIHGLSAEPLLGPIELPMLENLDWVIVGGESGKDARPCNVKWSRDIITQCDWEDVPCFVKQLGSRPVKDIQDARGDHCGCAGIDLKHPKGGDISEWPEDLRIREFPKGAR
jgi:protein gp37